MIYGYVRVSTIGQNVDRQMEEMYALGLDKKHIYVDYESGKDFNRTSYQKMIHKLRKDDLIYIKSIDRLGRNYDMIIEEWTKITKIICADIVVIDMPLLDTRIKGSNLIGKFISDIVLQVLSFVAQSERENIRQRQAEGIRIAKAKGVVFGRPKYILPTNFEEIVMHYLAKELTYIEAINLLNLKRSTFFKYVRSYRTK